MLISDWIDKMRRLTGDTRRRQQITGDTWKGDGSTTVFQVPDGSYPIYDVVGTYIVKVAGTTKTESSDYTLDKQTGTLTLNSAPTSNQQVTLDHSAVWLTNADWMQIFIDTIRSLGDDFWVEFVDDTNFLTTANALSLSLTASQPYCIAVYDFLYRQNTGVDWRPVSSYMNYRYSREENKLYLGRRDVFTVTGELFKIRGLKTFPIPTGISDTIGVQDRFMTIFDYAGQAHYWNWRYKHVVELVSKITQENTRTPLQELMMLNDRFNRMFEAEVKKLKPQKPARRIPVFIEGGGTP